MFPIVISNALVRQALFAAQQTPTLPHYVQYMALGERESFPAAVLPRPIACEERKVPPGFAYEDFQANEKIRRLFAPAIDLLKLAIFVARGAPQDPSS